MKDGRGTNKSTRNHDGWLVAVNSLPSSFDCRCRMEWIVNDDDMNREMRKKKKRDRERMADGT